MDSNDFVIDKHNLDKEWEKQPKLMDVYTSSLAEAIKEKDQLSLSLDILMSECSKNVRADPAQYRVDKVTDKSVAETVALLPAVIESQKELIQAIYKVSVLKGAVSSMEHKKTSLEWLSRLFLKNYYGTPSLIDAKNDLDYDMKKMEEENREALNNNPRLKRRRGVADGGVD